MPPAAREERDAGQDPNRKGKCYESASRESTLNNGPHYRAAGTGGPRGPQSCVSCRATWGIQQKQGAWLVWKVDFIPLDLIEWLILVLGWREEKLSDRWSKNGLQVTVRNWPGVWPWHRKGKYKGLKLDAHGQNHVWLPKKTPTMVQSPQNSLFSVRRIKKKWCSRKWKHAGQMMALGCKTDAAGHQGHGIGRKQIPRQSWHSYRPGQRPFSSHGAETHGRAYIYMVCIQPTQGPSCSEQTHQRAATSVPRLSGEKAVYQPLLTGLVSTTAQASYRSPPAYLPIYLAVFC